MRRIQQDLGNLDLRPVAICAALALAACGGGDGGNGAVFGADPTAAGGSSAATPPAVEAAPKPEAPPSKPRRRVSTPADIQRELDRERDRPSPVDRGGGPGRGKDAAVSKIIAPPGSGGQWSAPIGWPINAIHAVLTPDGKVMSYGTDPSGVQGAQLYYDVWNPTTQAHTLLQHNTRTDLFCSAQLVLPTTGQVLLAGGDTRGLGQGRFNNGVADVNLFDPVLLELKASGTPMAYARWYGSLIPLADGRVMAAAGIDGTGYGVSHPEIYTPGQGWKTLSGIENWPADIFYPRAVLTPSGRVFVATGDQMFSIRPEVPSMTTIGTLPKSINWLFPWALFDRGKILFVTDDGGALVVDVNGSTPVITEIEGPGPNREWGSATVLADGKVLVTGGSAQDNELIDTGYAAMVWDPKTGQWTVGASAQKPRLYHSTALLLPDATVVTMGGGSPGPVVNLNAEVYSPPYLFDTAGQRLPRPMINTAPAKLSLGADFSISVASSRPIKRVTLVRTGSVTHSTDFEQRFLELPFTQAAGASNVAVTLNEGPNTLPIGHYILYAIDDAGVPSVGKIVKVEATWTKVADQGQSFTLPAATVVQYGTEQSSVQKTVSGTVGCNNGFFGTNPAPTVAKTCKVLTPKAAGTVPGTAPPAGDRTVAAEGSTFSTSALAILNYGTGTRWVEKAVNGAATCSNAFFGSDPAPQVVKSCVADAGTVNQPPPAPPPPPPPPPPPSPAPPPSGTKLANEGGTFTVATATSVRYGADTRWVEKTVTGTATCGNAYFGADPAPFVVKSCVANDGAAPPPPPPPPPPPAPPPSGTTLAREGESFTVASATLVRYGADSRWIEKSVTGTAACSNAYFGTDPAPFVVKACVKAS